MSRPQRTTSFPPYVPTSAALVRESARRWGQRTLVVLGDERLSYAEVEARSARLA